MKNSRRSVSFEPRLDETPGISKPVMTSQSHKDIFSAIDLQHISGERPLTDDKFHVPSLNVLMSLVNEVRFACKGFKKIENR